MPRRTTRQIDDEARKVYEAWEDEERKAGRDPERPGAVGDLMDGPEGEKHPVVQAWWRLHIAAQRYG